MNRVAQAIRAAAIAPLAVQDGEAVRQYRFAAGFPAFEGHFPGFALLPAVVQIMAAATLVEDWRSAKLTLASVEKAKFLIQLRPGATVVVRCRERTIAGRRRYETSLVVEEGLAASFTLGFVEEDS